MLALAVPLAAGDAANAAVTGTCGDAGESVTVAAAPGTPPTSTTPGSSSVVSGTQTGTTGVAGVEAADGLPRTGASSWDRAAPALALLLMGALLVMCSRLLWSGLRRLHDTSSR